MIFQDKKVTFDEVKDKIVYVLMRKDEGFAETLPHVNYLDMMIVFYQSVGDNGYLPINYAYMTMLGVNEQDLLSVASENTSKLLGYKVCSAMNTIMECLGETPSNEDENIPLYIVSNKIHDNGAAVLLYPGFLKTLSNKLNCNFYIIPCSMHEIMIVKNISDIQLETLKDMIVHVNSTTLPPEDKLSDSLYYYDRETDKVTIV